MQRHTLYLWLETSPLGIAGGGTSAASCPLRTKQTCKADRGLISLGLLSCKQGSFEVAAESGESSA